jgi:hypothetical protein
VNTAASGFIDEMRADNELARIADATRCALLMIDSEADGNPHAAALWEGICFIISHADRTVEERLHAIVKLLQLEGKVRVNLREFLGWDMN